MFAIPICLETTVFFVLLVLLVTSSADVLINYTPINVEVWSTTTRTIVAYSICSLDQATVTTTANSVASCGLSCIATSNCIGFNFANDNGTCVVFGSKQSTNFATSATCQYFQKQPLDFTGSLTIGSKQLRFFVKFDITSGTSGYHVFFLLNYVPVCQPISSFIVKNHAACSMSCKANCACAGYIYNSPTGSCTEYNERLPASYTFQPPSIYYQKSPFTVAQNCLDHFNNGRTANETYTMFINGNPGLMINANCPHTTIVRSSYLARDCWDLQSSDVTYDSGIYYIYGAGDYFPVYCNMTIAGGGWTVVQRRVDGSVSFKRNWIEYADGFGILTGEHWLGNDHLATLTSSGRSMKIRFDMADKVGIWGFAEYSNFKVQPSSSKYLMTFGSYLGGDVGNSFSASNQLFTTYDQDNDKHNNSCSLIFLGGWWYNACHSCNPNGEYGNDLFGKGINWKSWRNLTYSLRFMEMKIKPM